MNVPPSTFTIANVTPFTVKVVTTGSDGPFRITLITAFTSLMSTVPSPVRSASALTSASVMNPSTMLMQMFMSSMSTTPSLFTSPWLPFAAQRADVAAALQVSSTPQTKAAARLTILLSLIVFIVFEI